ncbi:MAG: hypothetical protein HFG34_04465 [Eubacterium sp.]|nr:hypothetical protein [Eubacterium sp.]
MNQLQGKVLQHLLDLYEKSKTFLEINKVSQSFSVPVDRLFPRYKDDSEYDFFCRVNESLEELENLSFVFLERERNGILKKVVLNRDRLDECYKALGRTPRKEEQAHITELWEELCHESQRGDGRLQPLWDYIEVQKERIAGNKNVEYYEQDLEDYRDLLKLAVAALSNEQEIFIRTLSIQLFANSKRLEKLAPRLKALLFRYGEYGDKDSVLEECGIVRTPTYVVMKGNARIRLGSQRIDLSQIEGDLALSTSSLKELRQAEVLGERVVTIENLTTFHEFPSGSDFVVYLGGFHNKVKREFLLFLYKQNSHKEYRHFGDIDAGGFYILEHLKKKTGISFMSLMMDRKVLEKYRGSTMPLTGNDRRRLQSLYDELTRQVAEGTAVEDYRDTLAYMLEQNCKLEQEVVEI